jgi:hypothetical protein
VQRFSGCGIGILLDERCDFLGNFVLPFFVIGKAEKGPAC